MAYEVLDEAAIAGAMAELDGWILAADGLSICKDFRFHSFSQAFGFMSECALAAEKLDHHPDWKNSYTRVEVRLTTHVKRRLTDRDFKLAAAMDRAAACRL